MNNQWSKNSNQDLSQFVGPVDVMTMAGKQQTYIIAFADPTMSLKLRIKKDFNIQIKDQTLYHNKVNNQTKQWITQSIQ